MKFFLFLKPTLTEEELKAQVDFVKEVITKNGGEVASVIEMGARKLAYKIKKYERGLLCCLLHSPNCTYC